MGSALLAVGVAMVVAGQALAIASWWVLIRFTSDRVQQQRGMIAPFLLTFGLAAATSRTTLGGAIVQAEPDEGPKMQRRFRRGLALTMFGVLVAFGGLSL